MTGPEIKGWCPGALRPMLSGDGWLVRLRPRAGKLTAAQARGIADAATAHGNGTLDLSSRANLQMRGIREKTYPALIADLSRLNLIDPDIATESRRNIVVTPFHSAGDRTVDLAADLSDAVVTLRNLPGKFGFAVDTGAQPVLGATSADIRLERDSDGNVILRPDGYAYGKTVEIGQAVMAAVDLARWFIDAGGVQDGRGRMAALLRQGAILPPGFSVRAAPAAARPAPGRHDAGWLVAFAFGQMNAEQLYRLGDTGSDLRMTPWRMVLTEGPDSPPGDIGLVLDGTDPMLRVAACVGAPRCPQALGETRSLARRLAADLPAGVRLHVSGCRKGCASSEPTALTLVATADGYDLIRNGMASDRPIRQGLPTGLTGQMVLKDFDAP